MKKRPGLKWLLHGRERGITGLETAIILVAFATVAAVFSYAVLSAGLFSAERGKGTIHAGLDQARSNLDVVGSVIAFSADHSALSSIRFAVKTTITGKPVDMTPNNGDNSNQTVISLGGSDFHDKNVKWTCTPVGTDNGNYLLEPGEQFVIEIDLTDLGGSYVDPGLGRYDTFAIEVRPALGSALTVERTMGATISPVADLH
jgi:flagellin FlaB